MASSARQAKRERQREARRRKKQMSHRVLLKAPAYRQRKRLPTTNASAAATRVHVDRTNREREQACRREIYPVVRLDKGIVDWGHMPREGDEIGYCMHPYRSYDCLRAAIATATQIPVEEVPDLNLDGQREESRTAAEISSSCWERVTEWALARGLQIRFWSPDEIPAPRGRWIGVCVEDGGFLQDHCLVMAGGELLFDPSISVIPPLGYEMATPGPDAIRFGISLDERSK